MCMVQKATVLKAGKEKAIVRISSTGIEKEVKITRPVSEKQTVEIFQNIII